MLHERRPFGPPAASAWRYILTHRLLHHRPSHSAGAGLPTPRPSISPRASSGTPLAEWPDLHAAHAAEGAAAAAVTRPRAATADTATQCGPGDLPAAQASTLAGKDHDVCVFDVRVVAGGQGLVHVQQNTQPRQLPILRLVRSLHPEAMVPPLPRREVGTNPMDSGAPAALPTLMVGQRVEVFLQDWRYDAAQANLACAEAADWAVPVVATVVAAVLAAWGINWLREERTA